MRVAVVTNQAPFVRGGAELLAEWLAQNLEARGHEAQIVRIPFRWYPPQRILEHILATRLLRIDGADRVIAMKFPAYCVRHHSKVLWLLHQFRQAYDLLGTDYEELASTPEGRRVRESIVNADSAFLPEAERIFTNSAVTSARLREFNGLESEVLYPPLAEPEGFYAAEAGDYVVALGRISAIKRQYLLVEAMAHTRSAVRLVVAGPPDSERELLHLQELVDRYGLGARVEVIPRWITEEEKRDLLARSLGCAYVPFDEDSYGYVTLEAFSAQKPVVTTTDAGGILELVHDGETGIVSPPSPEALALALDRLFEDRRQAERFGSTGRERVHALRISWDHVVEQLLA